jgi:signal transduction histidine kinase
VSIRICQEDGDLVVVVDDDGVGGPGSLAAGGGNGIRGMRDRAAALGGQLTAGPRPGGGFRVRAQLPLSSQTTGAR